MKPEENSKTPRSGEDLAKDHGLDLDQLERALERLIEGGPKLRAAAENRALEKAKRLSVNHDFQAALDSFRRRWGITVRLPEELQSWRWRSPDEVISTVVFHHDPATKEHPSSEQWSQLEEELQELGAPFDLQWRFDQGLIIAAVCFGLTPEIILEKWHLLERLAAFGLPYATITTRHGDLERTLALTAAMAFLTRALEKVGVHLESLPEQIQDIAKHALSTCDSWSIDPLLQAPAFIDAIKGRPQDEPTSEPQLYIQVFPETTKADIDRIWPLVAFRQIRMLGRKTRPRQLREWRNYQIDVELARLYGILGDYNKVIDEYDKLRPGELGIERSSTGRYIPDPATNELVRQRVNRYIQATRSSKPKRRHRPPNKDA